MLVAQPLEDPPGRVPLLARRRRIRVPGQDRVDHTDKRTQPRPPRGTRRRYPGGLKTRASSSASPSRPRTHDGSAASRHPQRAPCVEPHSKAPYRSAPFPRPAQPSLPENPKEESHTRQVFVRCSRFRRSQPDGRVRPFSMSVYRLIGTLARACPAARSFEAVPPQEGGRAWGWRERGPETISLEEQQRFQSCQMQRMPNRPFGLCP